MNYYFKLLNKGLRINWIKWLSLFSFLFLVYIILYWWFPGGQQHYFHNHITNQLKLNIVSGMSYDNVESYLKSQKITYSKEDCHLYASYGVTSNGLCCSGVLLVDFLFSKQGRLVSYNIKDGWRCF